MSGAITGTTLAIMGGIGAAGAIGGAAISANAAGNAASTQANASDQAAQLQYQASQNALGFDETQFNQDQANLAPFLQSGDAATANLDYLLGINPPNTAGTPAGGALTPSSATATGTVRVPGPTSQVASPILNTGQGPIQAGIGQPTASTGPTPVPSVPGVTPTGTTNLSSTVNPSLGGFGSLLTPYSGTFTAPTAAEALQSPGEQAQLQLGEQAMQQSAAAQGNLLTGGTAQALDTYGQNLAQTDYQNTYNNAYNTYAANYNQYQQQQTNEYNRLAQLAGMGQTTASTLGTLGENAAGTVSNNLLGTASAIGQDTTNAAAANASGIVGSANAYSGALNSSTTNLDNLLLLSQLNNVNGSTVPTVPNSMYSSMN